jgi:predicted CopG family antitoxin
MPVSIKISDENYKKLCSLSGKLRVKLHKPVSINEAISFLYKKRKLSDLAGAWKMDDKEAEELTKNLKKGWSRWKTGSA